MVGRTIKEIQISKFETHMDSASTKLRLANVSLDVIQDLLEHLECYTEKHQCQVKMMHDEVASIRDRVCQFTRTLLDDLETTLL